MKKKQVPEEDDPLDREFDFSKARPNPYFVGYHGPKVIRVLEPDLAEIFPDHKSVNAALRVFANVAAQIANAAAQPPDDAAPAPKKKVSALRATAPKAKRKKAHS
jgi:hypothetical protein